MWAPLRVSGGAAALSAVRPVVRLGADAVQAPGNQTAVYCSMASAQPGRDRAVPRRAVGAVVGVESAVLLGVRTGVGGFVAAVERAVVQEAECHRVDFAAVRVDDRQAQAAVSLRADGVAEVDPQPHRCARDRDGEVGVAHDGVIVKGKAQLGEELGGLQGQVGSPVGVGLVLPARAGQGRSAAGAPARDAGRGERGRASGRDSPLHVERRGSRRAGRQDRSELDHALAVTERRFAPTEQWGRVGDALGDGSEQGDRGAGAGGRVPGRPVDGPAGPQLPAGVSGGQFGFRVQRPGGELQPGEAVG